jgi:hypothetical protein
MNFYAASVALLWSTAMRPFGPRDKIMRKTAEAAVCDEDRRALPAGPDIRVRLSVLRSRPHVKY